MLKGKTCSKCGQLKSKNDFHRHSQCRDGLLPYCKQCKNLQGRNLYKQEPGKRRNAMYKLRYGISLRDYDEMFHKQASGCAICGECPEGSWLSVDHCHETREVRGLLCRQCNVGLGNFRDSPELMRRAAEYVDDD